MKRALTIGACAAAAVVVALTACRQIVGITDLSVGPEGGLDASPLEDVAPLADALADTPVDGPLVDAGADAPAPNCNDVQDDASSGRQGCVSGCIQGHDTSLQSFFGTALIKACICKTCADLCLGFCGCSFTHRVACDDCASFVLTNPNGACRNLEDRSCDDGGCDSLATCLEQCPQQ